MLNRPGVVSVIGQLVPAGMAQHVRMNWKADVGVPARPGNHLPNIGIRQRPLALGHEHVGRFRVVTLQASQCPNLRPTEGMGAGGAVLTPIHMQQPLRQVHLIPAQGYDLGHSQAVTVGQQDQGGTPVTMPADLPGGIL